MFFSTMLKRPMSIAALLLVLLATGASCGEEPAPEPAPDIDLDALLTGAGEDLAARSTMRFSMVDEMESGAQFFGTTFKSLEADIKAPDSFSMVVEVEAPGFGFVEISMLAVGDQAFLKLSEDAPWNPLPLDQVPFNFSGLGLTFRDLLNTMKDGATVTGRESVQDTQAIRVAANLASDDFMSLITNADPGHEVALTLWIDETAQTLQQVRIEGRFYDDDDPETVRLLTILGTDIPVDIQVPDVGSES
jgi:hypothetical protein